MDALLRRLEKSLAKMGNIDNESINDTAVKRKGTSLDPPLYDSRTLFSMFTTGGPHKRVVDMDQIWNDATAKVSVDEPLKDDSDKKKIQRIKSHSRHIRPSPNTRTILQEQIVKHKESMAAIKRANSHPSLQTAHQQTRPSKSMKNSLSNYSTPISYHGFLAKEMKKASWESEPSLSSGSGEQSIAILKEIYQIR